MKTLLPSLQFFVETLQPESILESRKAILQDLTRYVYVEIAHRGEAQLHFICTHNSRRSQFSQIWAQTAAFYFDLQVQCFSGGVEVTEFNPRAVRTLQSQGFEIRSSGHQNPVYQVTYGAEGQHLFAFSKLFDDGINPSNHFAAVMTCGHAEENCPFIPGANNRIALLYEDPKAFDDTPEEAAKYLERSTQIATELFFVFEGVKRLVLSEG